MTPTRFLIASWDGGGNTPAAVNLGSRLARRGHRVRMLGWDSMAARAAEAGIEFAAYPSVAAWPEGVQQDDDWEQMEEYLHGADTMADILGEARVFRPDVLIFDCMMMAAWQAARRLGVPTVALVHVLYSEFAHSWGSQVMHTDVAALLAEADRVLSVQPPGFDVPLDLPGNTVEVGPIIRTETRMDPADLALLRERGDPWVLLSLSTTLQGQAHALPGLLAALATLPVRVLLTLGGVLAPRAVRVPANVTVREYVPHEAVLPYVSVVVSHGGLATITTSLAAGVPMVLVPQGREQPLNARRVHECGAGLVVTADAPPEELAGAVRAVLTDGAAAIAARGFADVIAGLGAGERATDLVEALAAQVGAGR